MVSLASLRRSALVALLVPVTLATAGTGTTAAADAPAAPLFFAAHGKCALQWKDGEGPLCRQSKFGNAFLPTFEPRTGEWGITYAFNCGQRKRAFSFTIDLTNWDQNVSATTFATRGKKGRGYIMETGKDTKSVATANAESDGFWGQLENVVVTSACQFSVRGVDGDAATVAKYVPNVPKKG